MIMSLEVMGSLYMSDLVDGCLEIRIYIYIYIYMHNQVTAIYTFYIHSNSQFVTSWSKSSIIIVPATKT